MMYTIRKKYQNIVTNVCIYIDCVFINNSALISVLRLRVEHNNEYNNSRLILFYDAQPIALEILDGLIDNIGYLENSYESDMTKSLRLLGVRWACKLGHTNCILAANKKLVEHLDDPNEHE